MHGFWTLSSPHLGYATWKSKLVKVGLWVMQTWSKNTSIQQLSMTDSKEISDTFMYKISKFKGMKWFKHIVLFSSVQDGYVTFDSARIQIFKNTSTQDLNSQGSSYIQMATNIFKGISSQTTVTRVDVNFWINEKSVDHLIGRKAHVLFLTNTGFLTMFTNELFLIGIKLKGSIAKKVSSSPICSLPLKVSLVFPLFSIWVSF